VSMAWPGAPEPVLKEVNLAIPRGTVAWIGGRNGAGKTTLLRIAAGLLAPRAGDAWVDGLHATRDRVAYQQRLGFVTASNTGLYARLTVHQQLELWARIAFVPRKERGGRIEAMVASLELTELAHRRVDRLSMGQRQRVRLALAFLHQPDILLLDEPRNSLDEEGTALLVGAVTRTVAQGGAALWCSPTLEETGCEIDARYRITDGELGEL